MNIMQQPDTIASNILPSGLSGRARDLLTEAMTLDLMQRRLIVAALRPGPKRDRGRVPHPRSAAGSFWLPFDPAAAAARRALFAGPAWRQAYKPGLEVHCYCLQAKGLENLVVDSGLGLSLAKLGTCLVGRLEERRAQLRSQAYGSVVRDGTAYVSEPGFDTWSPPPRVQLGAPEPFGPVRDSTASFIVTLPTGVTHSVFENDLKEATAFIGLSAFADSDAGRAWCAARGVDPHRLIRYSGDPARGTLEKSTEIALFRPQADGPALAAILEELVIGYVGVSRRTMAEAA